jgi:hypothetical protein
MDILIALRMIKIKESDFVPYRLADTRKKSRFIKRQKNETIFNKKNPNIVLMTNFYHSLLFRSYYICRRKKKKNFFRCFFVAKVRRVYKPEEIFSFSFQTKDVKFFYEKRS